MADRKLYEVTITKSFYWFGETPPGPFVAERCARDEGIDFDVDARAVSTDTLGAGPTSLVHGPIEDTTLAEAIAIAAKGGSDG